jgi:hypothetical protein
MTGRGVLPTLLLAGTLLSAAGAAVQPPGVTLHDRVLAVVDEDPILASDVDRQIGLGLDPDCQAKSGDELRRCVLEKLIDQRVLYHEVDRYGAGQVQVEAIEDQVAAIRARYPDQVTFEQALHTVGLDENGLRQLVARQLAILSYIDERLGPRVFVSLEDIRAYYQSTLVPELQKQGKTVPPIEQVREDIRRVLKEQRLNDEMMSWLRELRTQADIVDYFDTRHDQLPPVVPGKKPGG